jgi:hypothetical protein
LTQITTRGGGQASAVLERLGRCLELVPTDPHFNNISVGLYVKDDVCTVWTFSGKEGAAERMGEIRDQLVALGNMEAIEGAHDQAQFPCGYLHVRPVRFLLAQAVGKSPSYAHAEGGMSIKDTKSSLMLTVSGAEKQGKWVYSVSGEGDAPNPAVRLRLIVAGFVRYGEMEKVGDTEVMFPCGARHDALMRLLMPYSRNVSGVESMMEAEAMRGQMTTGTLGFTPST